jgi:uncharacterized protein YfdQ (DUF2303 family)
MSMDKTAIEQIQQSQTAQAVQGAVNSHALATPVVVVPEKFSLESMERHLANRVRARGQMATSVVDEFVQYVDSRDFTDQSMRCFINEDHMSATNIFNFGSDSEPGHCDDTAVLTLKKTAEYKALDVMDGERRSQQKVAEFFEDWAPNITFISESGEQLAPAKAIAAVRRITINASAKSESEQTNFRSERSALESISVDASNGLPAEIHFVAPAYIGLQPFCFECRLSCITGEKEPVLVLRIKRSEQLAELFAAEFSQLLKTKFEAIENSPLVTIGTYKTSH